MIAKQPTIIFVKNPTVAKIDAAVAVVRIWLAQATGQSLQNARTVRVVRAASSRPPAAAIGANIRAIGRLAASTTTSRRFLVNHIRRRAA
jgi:2-keto-3-deoxy-galactonokinase